MKSNLKEKGLGITRDATAASGGDKEEYGHVPALGGAWPPKTRGVVVHLDSALVWPHLE